MGYSYQRTVQLADTDAAGVVYFATLLHICHEAYEQCLTEMGLDWQALLNAKKIALPIVHADIDFFQPLRWGDRLTIELFPAIATDKLGQFTVTYQIHKESRVKLVSIAKTTHVAIAPIDQKRRQLPDIFEKWLKNAPKLPDGKS